MTHLSSALLSNSISWRLAPRWGKDQRSTAATGLQVAVEEAALQLASVLNTAPIRSSSLKRSVTTEFIEVKVEKITLNVEGENLPEDLVYMHEQSELRIPGSWLASKLDPKRIDDKYIDVAFFGFKNLHKVLSPNELDARSSSENESDRKDSCAWDADDHRDEEGSEDSGQNRLPTMASELNSHVLGASISNNVLMPTTRRPWSPLGDAEEAEIEDGPRIRFKNLRRVNATNENARVVCLYWNTELSHWASDGCRLESVTETEINCICNHLTNFAVLVDVEGFLPSHQGLSKAIQVITILGCTMSITCLLITAGVFTFVTSLRSQTATIHRNFCLSLAIAKIALLSGLDLTFNRSLCTVTAIILHYLFLVAFSWMLVEGVHIYIMVTQVFKSKNIKSRYYYLFSYGTPAVIVMISASTRTTAYGSKCYCWLTPGLSSALYFLGPLAAVLAINFCVLIIALRTAVSKSAATRASNKREDTRSWAKGAISLTFLLGLTWIFGFLVIGGANAVFAVIFTILNSFQGAFILAFYIVINERTRKETVQKMQRCYNSVRTASSQASAGVFFVFTRTASSTNSSQVRPSVSAEPGGQRGSINQGNDPGGMPWCSVTANEGIKGCGTADCNCGRIKRSRRPADRAGIDESNA